MTDADQKPDHSESPRPKAGKGGRDAEHAVLLETLEAHQVELETQNRKLEASRRRTEFLADQYADLFDYAPVGYVVTDGRLLILDANITFADMLDIPRDALMGGWLTRWVHRDDHDGFHLYWARVAGGKARQTAAVRMIRKDGAPVEVSLQSTAARGGASRQYRHAVIDLSEQRRSEKSRALTHRCLELSLRHDALQPLLTAFVREIKDHVGCDAVGIRIRRDDGRIPYQAFDGFSERFYLSESPLSLNTDRCMCIDVIKGETDPSLPFFTPGGSFYINGTSRFLAAVSEEEKGETRNVCHMEGYESVALAPIAMGKGILGLIHAADHRENMTPLHVVESLENAALHLGMALHKIHLQEELRASDREMRFLTSRLLTVQEEEQRRISMELHDDLGQDLSVLKLRLTTIQNRLRKDQKTLHGECQDLLDFTDGVIENVRRLAHGLYPSSVENLGLNAALRRLLREHADLSGMETIQEIPPLDDLFSGKTETMLYRIVQEALRNIRRHAAAKTVRIRFRKADDRLLMSIRDDGRGFAAESRGNADAPAEGMGMAAMKFRARLIGADFTVSSRPGGGTEIALGIPASGKKGAAE